MEKSAEFILRSNGISHLLDAGVSYEKIISIIPLETCNQLIGWGFAISKLIHLGLDFEKDIIPIADTKILPLITGFPHSTYSYHKELENLKKAGVNLKKLVGSKHAPKIITKSNIVLELLKHGKDDLSWILEHCDDWTIDFLISDKRVCYLATADISLKQIMTIDDEKTRQSVLKQGYWISRYKEQHPDTSFDDIVENIRQGKTYQQRRY